MLISEVDAVPQPRLLFCNGLIFLFPSHQFAQQPQITGKLMVLPEESNLKIVHRPISNFVGAQMLMVMEEKESIVQSNCAMGTFASFFRHQHQHLPTHKVCLTNHWRD